MIVKAEKVLPASSCSVKYEAIYLLQNYWALFLSDNWDPFNGWWKIQLQNSMSDTAFFFFFLIFPAAHGLMIQTYTII